MIIEDTIVEEIINEGVNNTNTGMVTAHAPVPSMDEETFDKVSNIDDTDMIIADNYPQNQVGGPPRFHMSPGMTGYYIPTCDPALTPFIGQQFTTLQLAIDFYRTYGANCGFDVRRSSDKRGRGGTVTHKYVVCNRQGEKNERPPNTEGGAECSKKNKHKISRRLGCMASITFKLVAGAGYSVMSFEDKHSHPLASQMHRHFLKVNRNLDIGHQIFLIKCKIANLGPVKSYRIYKEIVGGYGNIGCTSVDFKNFSRDLKAFAAGADAQMILDNLTHRRNISPGFFFAYDVNEKDQLTRLFWADAKSIRNYAAYGDVVSFDATYETNRYNMIFTPFTGVDSHRRIITFGAALLSGEAVDSYSWVQKKFVECMGRHPGMIITDQDPALGIAIENVLEHTRHRLCMWHITKKILDKLPHHLRNDTTFKKRIDSVIWSESMEPEEFDQKWTDIINDFHLQDHDWFSQMYEYREYWIPAYFRDHPFSGLLRTTSLSESVNSFFSRYLNPKSNLVEFFMQYDSALDAQRHAQDQLNFDTLSAKPVLRTPLAIERHALDVYTNKIFLETQGEIVDACFNLRAEKSVEDNGCLYKIENCSSAKAEVVFNSVDSTYVCSCKKFVKMGLLCSHIFFVLKDLHVQVIPEKYISIRWTKFALTKSISDGVADGELTSVVAEENNILRSQLLASFYKCFGLVDGHNERMSYVLNKLNECSDYILNLDPSLQPISTKRKLFEDYYGSSAPDVISVLPPAEVKTKGSGRRLKSSKEKAIEISKKPLRVCRKCNQLANHDKRNCDKVSKNSVV